MYFAASNGVGTTKGSWEQSFVLIWERRWNKCLDIWCNVFNRQGQRQVQGLWEMKFGECGPSRFTLLFFVIVLCLSDGGMSSLLCFFVIVQNFIL